MKKYYFKEGGVQYGPLELKDLKTQNLTAETPVWYHPLPHWTTAGKVEELKDIIKQLHPVVETKEEIKSPVVETPVATVAEEPGITPVPEPILTVKQEPVVAAIPEPQAPSIVKPVIAATTTTVASPVAAIPAATPFVVAAKPRRRNTAWISWVLSLLVLGATGYFIYNDMQKKSGTVTEVKDPGITDSTENTVARQPAILTLDSTLPEITDTTKVLTLRPETSPTEIPTTQTSATERPATVKPQPSTTKVITRQPSTSKTTSPQAEQLLVQIKADEEKRKKDEQLVNGKYAEIRNHWPKYISLGKLDYQSHSLSGIKAFDVPLFNSTDAILDRVTVRLDYIKSGGGVYKTETIVLNDISPRSGVNGKAPASSRGTSVNAYITAVTSKKLHFCYPQNNGNTADPYFCN